MNNIKYGPFDSPSIRFKVFSPFVNKNRLGVLIVPFIILGFAIVSQAAATPENWVQVNNDGFFGHPPGSMIFTFGPDLYGYDSQGLYRMQMTPCLEWKRLMVPTSTGDWTFKPLGDALYLSKDDQLWSIKVGNDFSGANWIKVSLDGLPAGTRLVPLTIFNGQIYASGYSPEKDTFDIWRSPDIDEPSMQWSKVISDGFNNPQNHEIAFMPILNNMTILAVTTATRDNVFGAPSGYGSGIEVWESASGDPGSWTQVNEDGFGTEVTIRNPPKTFRSNQDAGSWAVFNGNLYIGTLSHWGAEVWRYDGTGSNSWTEVTPPWAGPCPPDVFIGCGDPGRNNAMAIFENYLYLAEGFSTGSLAKYDGTSWIQVLNAKDFDKTDSGFTSLAMLGDKLYVATLHDPTYNAAR
jgi:hypothetical protein